MKVVLLQDVKGIGRRFEEKEVNDGHARNFLLPRKLAVPAGTPAATQARQRAQDQTLGQTRAKDSLHAAISLISSTTTKISLATNEQGHLFEKLTAEKIADFLKKEKGIDIDAKYFNLTAPIKEIGTFQVPILTEKGKETSFTLEVERA